MVNRVLNSVIEKTHKIVERTKPGLRHLHIWGFLAKVRAYNPNERKLDANTISGYFEKFKMYRFHSPNYSTKIFEFDNAWFIENGQVIESLETRKMDI